MNKIEIFKNADFGEVRALTINNEPYFVGKDVAEILGYAKARNAIAAHVDEEDRHDALIQGVTDSLGREQSMTFINESGLYSLVLSSKLPTAKKFKHWVTSEVLPTIRKHGMYATDELLNNPDFAIQAFTALKEERERRKELEAKVKADQPKIIFADAVSVANTSILIGELAKILKQNGVNIGQNRLFEYMRENGYLISRNGTDRNMPTQKAMEMGLFEIKETTISHADGHTTINKTPKVTGKGQQYFINKFLH